LLRQGFRSEDPGGIRRSEVTVLAERIGVVVHPAELLVRWRGGVGWLQ
jgi:hypothetical protein